MSFLLPDPGSQGCRPLCPQSPRDNAHHLFVHSCKQGNREGGLADLQTRPTKRPHKLKSGGSLRGASCSLAAGAEMCGSQGWASASQPLTGDPLFSPPQSPAPVASPPGWCHGWNHSGLTHLPPGPGQGKDGRDPEGNVSPAAVLKIATRRGCGGSRRCVENCHPAWVRWLTCVIPATWEAEIRGILV
jgi:hypothetical protein